MTRRSIDRKGDDVVAALEVDLRVSARTDDNVLLAVDRVGGRRRVDAGSGKERPQDLAALGVIGPEPAVALAGEHETAGRGERAAHHRQRRLHLPLDLAGVVVDGGDVAEALQVRDHLEGAAEPQLAVGIGRALDLVGHRLVQVDGIGQAELRIDRHHRPLDAAVGAGQHLGALGRRQGPHARLIHHRLGEADEAAVLAVVDVDVAGLAGVDDAGNRVAVLVLHVDQDRRAHRVEIPQVVGDVLEVAGVLAGVEIERDQRVRVEVVAGTDRAVEVGRRVADDEVDALRLEVDRGVLPHAAAERLVGIAELLQRRLLGRDVAMHVLAGGVMRRPYAGGVLSRRVEVPHELAGLRIVGAHEAADAVLAAVGADQDLAVDGGRRHRLAVAELGIGDLGLPQQAAGLGVERDQLGIERRHVDLVAVDGDAAVVGAAAIGRDRAHLVLVVPVLLAGLGVERVDVIERRRHVHHAVDDDRRRLHRLLHLRLEDPGRMQLADVGGVDLLAREVAGLIVVAVGVQEVVGVAWPRR